MKKLLGLTTAAIMACVPPALADGYYNLFGSHGDKWGEIRFEDTHGDDAVWIWPNEEGESVFFIDNPNAARGDWSRGTYDGYYVVDMPDHISSPCSYAISDAFGNVAEEWGTVRMQWTGQDGFRLTTWRCGGQNIELDVTARYGTGPSDYDAAVPVAAELFLQSYEIPVSVDDPAYTEQGLDKNPSINLNIDFSDGSRQGHDYLKYHAANIVFDDVSGDPNDIIEIVPWPVDNNDPSQGTYAGQLTSTGKGVGTARLLVSFRDAPHVTAAVTVSVVSAAPQFDVPVSASLSLQGYKLPLGRQDPAHLVSRLSTVQAIYVSALFADGSAADNFYHRDFADNVIIDAVSGDPDDLIRTVEWPVDKNNPQSATYSGQVEATGRGTGTANLLVSFRNAPGVTASVAVKVVSGRQ